MIFAELVPRHGLTYCAAWPRSWRMIDVPGEERYQVSAPEWCRRQRLVCHSHSRLPRLASPASRTSWMDAPGIFCTALRSSLGTGTRPDRSGPGPLSGDEWSLPDLESPSARSQVRPDQARFTCQHLVLRPKRKSVPQLADRTAHTGMRETRESSPTPASREIRVAIAIAGSG